MKSSQNELVASRSECGIGDADLKPMQPSATTMIIRRAAAVGAVMALAMTLLVSTGTPAQAAPLPSCRITGLSWILGLASGGCDGYGGVGAERVVVRCTGYRGVVIHVAGSWMHRWQSWHYVVACPGGYGYHASAAWIERRSW